MSSEPKWPGEATFERRLLESARSDARPDQVKEAWARFAGGFDSLVSDPSSDLGVPAGRATAPSTIGASVAGASVSWPHALKWLLLGALGGSGLTAALMVGREPPRLDTHVAEGKATPFIEANQATPDAPRVPDTADVQRSCNESSRAIPHHRGPFVVRSTLAEEVSRIDTARTAISLGDPDQALDLIERYHHEFPNGTLAHDAEVVALEAAATKRDRADVERRAQRFLSRYPHDPQAARVRSLAESLRER